MEVNRASVNVASGQDRLNWIYVWLTRVCVCVNIHKYTHTHNVKVIWRQHGWMSDPQESVNTLNLLCYTHSHRKHTLTSTHYRSIVHAVRHCLLTALTKYSWITSECDVTLFSECNMQEDTLSKAWTNPGICNFELPEDVLRHVVLRHGVHHKVLIPGWALSGPVLVTLLLSEQNT